MTRRTMAIVAGIILLAAVIWLFAKPGTPAAPAASKPEPVAPSDALPSSVRLSAEQIRTADIGLASVEAGGAGELIVPATVRAAPTGIARLDARADGVVSRILKRLGDPVARGATVATLESSQAAALTQQVAAARARATEAETIYQREKRLFEARVTARQDLEAAQANLAVARSELTSARAAVDAAGVTSDGRSISVTSPVAGRIAAAPAVLGSYVTAGTELFQVVNPTQIQVEAALSPDLAARVSVGDRASVALPGGGQVSARVRSITPSLDPQSRTATAVLSLERTPPGLQTDSFVQVRLSTAPASGGVLSVPEEAVQDLKSRSIVFVQTKTGFRVVPVTTGERSGGRVTILSGLTTGQKVASRNAFLIKAEISKQGEEE